MKRIAAAILACVLPAPLPAQEEAPAAAPPPAFARITFENISPDLHAACRRIIVSTALHFRKLTGVEAGRMPMTVRFEETARLEVDHAEAILGAQGVCVVTAEGAAIRVAVNGAQAVAPVLAHEAAHAFVAEAYGSARNRHLNEGLAQYLACLAHPPLRGDLRRFWLRGNYDASASPYVAGFHFVDEHAEDPRFPEFFQAYVDRVEAGYDDLEELWQRGRMKAR